MRVPLFIFVVVLILAPTRPSGAADDPREIARAHYARGLDLAGQSDYEAALKEFTEAYKVSPHFAVLYNIGQAQIAFGRPQEAAETLAKYLRDGQEQVPRDRRQQVEGQIRLLESLFAELTITTDRLGALIAIDGREIGRTPLFQSVRLAAGTHKVSAVAGAGVVVDRTVTLGQGDRQFLNIDLPSSPSVTSETPASQPAPPRAVETTAVSAPAVLIAPIAPTTSPPPDQRPAPDSSNRRHPKLTLALTLVSVGAALGGGALGVYLANRGRYQDWRSDNAALQRDKGATDYYTRQIASNQRADSLAAANHLITGLSIAGGLVLAGGVTLLVLDRFHVGSKQETEAGAAASGIRFAWGGRGSSSGYVSWSAAW